MIRSFVGVRIDPEVTEKISEVQTQLKRSLAGIRWVARENLHFTLKFLGAVPEEKIPAIMSTLEETLRPILRFRIVGRGIGVFPDIRGARVLWVGLDGDRLESLAREVEATLEPLGFEAEKRAFQPHLTIGRWRNFDGKPRQLREELERWKDFVFGESWVEEVVLFQSILKPEGAVYSPLKVVPLSAPPACGSEMA